MLRNEKEELCPLSMNISFIKTFHINDIWTYLLLSSSFNKKQGIKTQVVKRA